MIATKLLELYLLILVAIISVLLSIAIIRTMSVVVEEALPPCTFTETDYIVDDGLSSRFSQALTYKTITYEPRNHDGEELGKFIAFLIKSFPILHSSPLVKKEVVNRFSLLYTIKGSDPSLKPYMLAGHMDVVPVDVEKWELPPFSGKIENGFINGRGSIDAKHIVLGTLEALEFLLKNDFHPQRSFYLAYGHDEEGGGYNGAAEINKLLLSRGVKLEYILDEGSIILSNLIPGVKPPTALISVSEKGHLNLRLTVENTPGHSALAPVETSINILSKAVAKLPGNVFKSMFGSDIDYELFHALAPCAKLPFRFLYSNLWLFKPVISWVMDKNHITRSFIKTTCATTKISGGTKDNVLPSNASAVLNVRIHPLQTIDQAIEYIKDVINDERVNIDVISSTAPHPVSPFSETDFGYNTIKNSIRQIFPESCVVPSLLIANTDTRWYLNLSDAIYRFSPVTHTPDELPRYHGHNEKIHVNNYIQAVNFYLHLIKNSNEKVLKSKHSHGEL